MVKANALFMVIAVALIIGIISTGLILLSFNYRQYISYNLLRQKLDVNAISGVNLLLAENNFLIPGAATTMDLYAEGADSVYVKKLRWGIFDIGISKAFKGKFAKTKIFQIGSRPSGQTSAAIYLVDEGTSLAVSGKTIINGTCYLPERGVQAAQIAGNFFSGNKFINGSILKSAAKLPAMDKDHVEIIGRLLQFDSKTETGNTLPQADSVKCSFIEDTIFDYHAGPFIIDKKYFGNIVFISDTIITVEKDAKLEDVIIVAPRVIFKNGFHGNVQAFASDSLAIGEECMLEYPTALGILKTGFSHHQPSLTIGKGAHVDGFVFSYQFVEDTRRTLISGGAETEITGFIYSDGFLELKGKVFGGVMCKRFVLNTSSSFYENHLLNVTIDHDALSEYYLMPSMLETEDVKKVVKWLY
jgi:hypothetical protein